MPHQSFMDSPLFIDMVVLIAVLVVVFIPIIIAACCASKKPDRPSTGGRNYAGGFFGLE